MIHPYLLVPALIGGAMLFFVEIGVGPASPLRQLTGFGHLFYFGLLAWWLSLLPPVRNQSLPRQFALILAVVVLLGAAIELIQPYVGRQRSLSDLGINLLGGLLGLLFPGPGRRLRPRGLLAAGRLALLLAAAVVFSGPVAALRDMQQADRRFPLLADFESRLEVGRWSSGSRDSSLARRGRSSLRVELGPERYAGTALRRSLGNWRGYSTFAFSLHNPGPGELNLTISIRDRQHDRAGGRYEDRFNRSFELAPGWSDLRIPVAEIEKGPVARNLDLGNLTEVIFFTSRELPAARVIHLDYLRLLP